jgi:hypothetical protein
VAYGALCLYLFHDVQSQGDGAAYSLQALAGSPGERSVHIGALAPLWFGVRVLGLSPNIVPALWTGLALVASAGIGHQILGLHPPRPGQPPTPVSSSLGACLGPLTMMAAALTWEGALFVEIYSALGALLLLSLWAAMADRRWLAGIALAWAAAAHPGAWALVPGLVMLSPRRSLKAWLPSLGLAAVLHGGLLIALFPDWWSGGRGLRDIPPSDLALWPALQSLWRILSDDLGTAALPLLFGLPLLGRKQLIGLSLVVLGTAALLCRYSDNPGGLPALWILLAFTPLALRALAEVELVRLRRGLGTLGVIVLLFGIGDATSSHDARARQAQRDHEARLEAGCPGPADLPWSQQQLWKLSCRQPNPSPSSP